MPRRVAITGGHWVIECTRVPSLQMIGGCSRGLACTTISPALSPSLPGEVPPGGLGGCVRSRHLQLPPGPHPCAWQPEHLHACDFLHTVPSGHVHVLAAVGVPPGVSARRSSMPAECP